MSDLIKTIEINHKQIAYQFINEEVRGENLPLIVFLHEGLGCMEQWRKFPEVLCKELKIPGLMYDRYGHGKSSGLKELRQPNYMHLEAEFLKELIQKLNIKNPLILFGHSDGGTISLLYASKFKKQIKAIITEAAHIFLEVISLQGIQKAVISFKEGKLKHALEKYHGKNTATMFEGWADTWLSKEFMDWNIEEEIMQIECPVLAIQGINDQYGSEQQVDGILNKVAGESEKFMIEKCGHIPHIEAQKEVIEKVISFVMKNLKQIT